MKYNSPRGTSDLYGEDILYRNYIINIAKKLFKIYLYDEIITPTFEHTEVFTRSIGESSDIVSKEMYTFLDKKGRSLTLRPEGTAPVIRAFIENKFYSQQLPIKLSYIGNMFRYERPQKGRMREFSQLGVEAIGSDDPTIDAEVIWLLNQLFLDLGFKNLKLLINSIECTECRKGFTIILEEYLNKFKKDLCDECKVRFGKNTLRIYDCKVKSCKNILTNAPKIDSFICRECTLHFQKVLKLLDVLEISYTINSELVRGFDYYTRTIFEIISEEIESAQNALGGGGRYDNLVKQFGGPDLTSIGFAIGIERTSLMMKQLKILPKSDNGSKKIYFIRFDNKNDIDIFSLLKFFRNKNYYCDINFNIKNLSAEMKLAQKNDFDFVIIIGDKEIKEGTITIKNIKNFEQTVFNLKRESSKIIDFIENK